jgi:hypothetical protein
MNERLKIEGATIEVPKLDPDTMLVSGTGVVLADIDLYRKLNEQGLKPGELTTVINALEERADEAGHMVSIVKKRSGIRNTLFASTGDGRHAARIKIAIDPPDSLNERCNGTSMALHDFSTVGAHAPSQLLKQAMAFIELNRDALVEYWDAKIDTETFLERLKPIPSRRSPPKRQNTDY